MEIRVSEAKNVLDDNSRSFVERQAQIHQEEIAEMKQRERAKKSPYSNFYQFNRDHSKEMMWLADKHPKANVILLFLLDQMDEYNAVMASYQVLSEALDTTTRTISRGIKVLKDHGFVAILKSGTSNVYIVNQKLAWSSWGKNYKYCKFPANVILSASENQEYLENIEKAKFKQINIKGNE